MLNETKSNIIRSMQQYDAIGSILSCLDIPYAVIKGEPLSLLSYQKIGARNSSDIDILIDRKHLSSIEKELTASGFSMLANGNSLDSRITRILCLSHSHQVPPYVKNTKNFQVEVDLNFDIFWGEYQGPRIDIAEFVQDAVDVVIHGKQIKTLPPLKAMLQLALHHYKEMNSIYHLTSHNSINRNMFNDIYYLWKNNQNELTLNNLYLLGNKYNVIPYIFYMLYYTNLLYSDPLLQVYINTLKTPEGEYLLDYYGLSDEERKPWRIDFLTRLNSTNLPAIIYPDLKQSDLDKLRLNNLIFG